MNTTVLILAAGKGTRMRSKRAKVLHRAGGLALVEHVVRAAGSVAPVDRTVVVTGHQAEQVEASLAGRGLTFVRQGDPQGTGHAVAVCREAASGWDGLVMLLYGDVPMLSAATIQKLRDAQASSDAAGTVITTTVDDPAEYGRVLVDRDGYITAIVEYKVCTPEQRAIRVINSGICCFRADLLWKHIGEIQPNATSGELYLTDLPEILAKHGHRMRALHVDDSSELAGINTLVELAEADRIFRDRKRRELMLAGVAIEAPETVTIDVDVRVGADTAIEPMVRLLGNTVIGEDCAVGAGSILEDAVLEDGVLIRPYSVIAQSRVATGAQVGPFARLRMGTEVGADARIGNFVELKKTRFGKGSKSQHLAYLGDATVGEGVNYGAGSITCNYDGVDKHETHIGDRVFVGTNSTLVAPLDVGAGAYIGAGSVITDEVPAKSLALGRARQVVKQGWTKKPKKKIAADERG